MERTGHERRRRLNYRYGPPFTTTLDVRTKPRPWLGVIALSAAALVSAGSVHAQTPRTLRADMALIVQCEQRASSQLETQIEGFLRLAGFKVLNAGQVQREHGVRVFELHVFGLEGKERLLDFLTLPQTQGRYAVTLYSRPPTVRAASLEQGVEAFIAKDMKCRVDQTTRGENPAEALDLFEDQMRRRERLFVQAEELKSKGKR